MIRRLLTMLALASLASVFTVPIASASPPTVETFSGSFLLHAGQMCDFEFLQEWSGTDRLVVVRDGRVQIHEKLTVVRTNLETGYTLTETDQLNYLVTPDGSFRQTAVWFHLRNPDDKLVVLLAGMALFDADFNLIKVTPNLDHGFAETICPALGGHPA